MWTRLFDAVLFDRDGTLVEDVPYNGDPEAVRPMPGARAALDRLRAAGLRVGVVTNQSGLARGRFGPSDLDRVHRRIEQLLGPFDTWQVCPHDEAAGCWCRKPAPGLVLAAARALATVPGRCVVVGDIGRDMAAAGAAGAFGVLVPTAVTRTEETAAAPSVAGDLSQAVDLILRRQRLGAAPAAGTESSSAESSGDLVGRPRAGHVLVVRADAAGDVLLTGPAIRAVAAGAERVTMLCGPRGRSAAELLPGVDAVVEHPLPWIDPLPPPPEHVRSAALRRSHVDDLVARLAAIGADEALVFTSFHQSALPLALVLRMAGVARISAISEDYPGSLLDLRHRPPLGLPEAERALSLAAAAGFALPPGDDGALRVKTPTVPAGQGAYVVVHPGASVPARACPPERCAEIVTALAAAGRRVLVTGAPSERELTASVAGSHGVDLGGRTDLGELAAVIAGARCAVVANTGPAHLAVAVGTPVVSLFAPTVPFGQWGPYRVPWVRLGDATAACRNTRATACPVPGHPCLSTVDPGEVVAAVATLDRVRG